MLWFAPTFNFKTPLAGVYAVKWEPEPAPTVNNESLLEGATNVWTVAPEPLATPTSSTNLDFNI